MCAFIFKAMLSRCTYKPIKSIYQVKKHTCKWTDNKENHVKVLHTCWVTIHTQVRDVITHVLPVIQLIFHVKQCARLIDGEIVHFGTLCVMNTSNVTLYWSFINYFLNNVPNGSRGLYWSHPMLLDHTWCNKATLEQNNRDDSTRHVALCSCISPWKPSENKLTLMFDIYLLWVYIH